MTHPDITPSRRSLLIAGLLVVVPGWLFIYGAPQRVWTEATLQFLRGETLYMQGESPVNPHTTDYVYLPVFAMLNGILLAVPYYLSLALGWSESMFELTIGYALTALWGYIGYFGLLAAVRAHFTTSDRTGLILAVGVVAIYPATFIAATYRGADLVIAALLVTVIFAAGRDRWFAAGLAGSIATFKLLGIPSLGILAAYVYLTQNRQRIRELVSGLAVGQLPNIAYYLVFPGDFLLLVRHRGALSTYAYRIRAIDTYLLPVQWAGLEAEYAATIFPIVVVVATLAGIWIAVRIDLTAGLMVGYFAMSYLIPAESRPLPFIVLLLVLLVRLRDAEWARIGLFALVLANVYRHIARVFPDGRWEPLYIDHSLFLHAEVLLHGLLFLACIGALYSRTQARQATPDSMGVWS